MLVASASRSHSSTGPPARRDLPGPPGTSTMSGLLDFLERALGEQREHAVVGAHRSRLDGDEHDARAGEPAEHLVGPDGVERGEAVVKDDRDVHVTVSFVGVLAAAGACAADSPWRRESAGDTRLGRRAACEGTRGASSPRYRSRSWRRRRRAAPPCPPAAGAQPRGALARRSGRASRRSRRGRRARSDAGSCARARPSPRREWSPATSSMTSRWISRSGSRWGCCAMSVALNCDWLPGRRRNSTRWRAIVSAASRSRSSSTSASARSMPAVTPAEVQIGPSRTKIGSGSTCTSGCSRRSSLGGCPVRRRAAAIEQAGVSEHEGAGANRGGSSCFDDASAIQSSSTGSFAAVDVAVTSGDDQRVDRLGRVLQAASGVIVRPLEVRSGVPSQASTCTR